jgi:hypothetical protein
MFTLKLYNWNGGRCDIVEAESFTILRAAKSERVAPKEPIGHSSGYAALAEITAHLKNGESRRYDIQGHGDPAWPVPSFEKAIIENSAGRTTEIVGYDIVPPSSAIAA